MFAPTIDNGCEWILCACVLCAVVVAVVLTLLRSAHLIISTTGFGVHCPRSMWLIKTRKRHGQPSAECIYKRQRTIVMNHLCSTAVHVKSSLQFCWCSSPVLIESENGEQIEVHYGNVSVSARLRWNKVFEICVFRVRGPELKQKKWIFHFRNYFSPEFWPLLSRQVAMSPTFCPVRMTSTD